MPAYISLLRVERELEGILLRDVPKEYDSGCPEAKG